jgi:hypothetical protein
MCKDRDLFEANVLVTILNHNLEDLHRVFHQYLKDE